MPVIETTTLCKICGGAAPVFACVDFEKHCNKQLVEERFADTPVKYFRCVRCHFIFTPFLDDHSTADLVARVYNEDYIKFDPLYPVIRPRMNAGFLRSIVEEARLSPGPVRILDYGAGNGMLSQILEETLPVENYDALNPAFDRLPEGQFDLLFCSEVVEHIPEPHRLMADWERLLNAQGAVLFSTMTQPDDVASLRGDWWYLGPRNGHVSLYSRYSLDLLCQRHDLFYAPIDEQWHLAARDPDHGFDLIRVKAVADRLPKGFIEV